MLTKKLLRLAYRVALIGFVLYIFWSSPSVNRWLVLNSILDCDLDAELLEDSDNWQITSSSIPSQILWQKAEPITRPPFYVGTSITGFIASNGQVIYWQTSGSESCDKLPIVAAFDADSGRELWRYRPKNTIYKLFAVTDGYVLLDVDRIIKIDYQGQEVWRQTAFEEIPIRDFSIMYEFDAMLFFPSLNGQTYEFSLNTGDLIRSENQSEVIAHFDPFAPIKSSENGVSLTHLDRGNEVVYALYYPSMPFRNVSLNPGYLFATRHQDKFLLSFDSTGFEVHDFETGRLLWEVYKPIIDEPRFVRNALVVYTPDNKLEVYDIQTGEVLGDIHLALRDSSGAEDNTSLGSIWITAYQETVFIRQIDRLELIAIKLDLDF